MPQKFPPGQDGNAICQITANQNVALLNILDKIAENT